MIIKARKRTFSFPSLFQIKKKERKNISAFFVLGNDFFNTIFHECIYLIRINLCVDEIWRKKRERDTRGQKKKKLISSFLPAA